MCNISEGRVCITTLLSVTPYVPKYPCDDFLLAAAFFSKMLKLNGSLWNFEQPESSWHWANTRFTTDKQFITGLTHTDKQPLALTLTPSGNLESPVNPAYTVVVGGSWSNEDGINPSSARGSAGTSPAGNFWVEVKDCVCGVVRVKSFDVALPAQPVLCYQTGRLLGAFQ